MLYDPDFVLDVTLAAHGLPLCRARIVHCEHTESIMIAAHCRERQPSILGLMKATIREVERILNSTYEERPPS